MKTVQKYIITVLFLSSVAMVFSAIPLIADPGCSVTLCLSMCEHQDTVYICSLMGKAEHYDENDSPLPVSLTLHLHCTYVGPFWFDECERVETFSGNGLISGTINCTLNSGIFEGVCLVDKSCVCN
ncbi:hypothetical protein AT15_03070 [Kosmotoga arenicorallina S304]|uniref:Uncharacterized protein n=1 Tax=Kosmotoga arenicorallina S304 TaxID=1453497 RepID=A0A182C7Y1_9BACT|nr:hypothetical protein AT15_03070 [Kosmotoga arenicorallina S304]